MFVHLALAHGRGWVAWVMAEGRFCSQPVSPAPLPATVTLKSGVKREVETVSVDPGVCHPRCHLAVALEPAVWCPAGCSSKCSLA